MSDQIFSFHLAQLPVYKLPGFLMSSQSSPQGFTDPLHSERCFTMNLGVPVLKSFRYNLSTVSYFAWWKNESQLEEFLTHPTHHFLSAGWHVRMRLYRRWGKISELENAIVSPELAQPENPVVAVTLARLRLSETTRFIRFGRPVESQVRDHAGNRLALAAMRPPNTFSTFSIWKNETEMLNMVRGHNHQHDGESHRLAMQERTRKDFHHEFCTMRFTPFAEHGKWNQKSNYTTP